MRIAYQWRSPSRVCAWDRATCEPAYNRTLSPEVSRHDLPKLLMPKLERVRWPRRDPLRREAIHRQPRLPPHVVPRQCLHPLIQRSEVKLLEPLGDLLLQLSEPAARPCLRRINAKRSHLLLRRPIRDLRPEVVPVASKRRSRRVAANVPREASAAWVEGASPKHLLEVGEVAWTTASADELFSTLDEARRVGDRREPLSAYNAAAPPPQRSKILGSPRVLYP